MMTLVERKNGTQKTLDAFKDAELSWGDDSPAMTCAHILHDHLVNMGHSPPTVPDFSSPAEAHRAMKEMGYDSLSDMLDTLLEPIAPAYMKLGDVVIAPGEGGMEAVLICAGPFKLFGLSPDEGDHTVKIDFDMNAITGAWTVG